jgi:mannitol-1-/sugar-/sorbitol-6-/2-deoxyglucose-6-phosphatase
VKYDAVIFDMDGVLIDSEPFWRQAELSVFPDYNIHITEDDCRSTAGLRIFEVVQHWMQVFNLPQLNAETIANQVVHEVIRLVHSSGQALPGVYASLDHITEMHIPIAVATSSPKLLMEAVLSKLNIQSKIKFAVSADGLEYAKPHPEIFLKTAKLLGVHPTRCLVIEDTINGMIAAKAARMTVCVVPEPIAYNNPRFALADQVLNNLNELKLA